MSLLLAKRVCRTCRLWHEAKQRKTSSNSFYMATSLQLSPSPIM